ncbi:hypothetical protein ABZ436_23610 [Micromonospora matsumotoense]|uniref:hypothetical protein n=1 Tax=Micromonospora matsumotoense TaxID=121616 RepID=UPI0033D1BFBF
MSSADSSGAPRSGADGAAGSPTPDKPIRQPLRQRIVTGPGIKGFTVDLGSNSSAATLHENAEQRPRALVDRQEQALRSGLVELLRDGPLHDLGDRITRAADRILEGLPDIDRPERLGDQASLIKRLSELDDTTAALQVTERRAVCLAVEQVLASGGNRELWRRIVPQLHRRYGRVFQTLPLAQENLWSVPLTEEGEPSISSMLVVPNGSVPAARLVRDVHEAFTAGRDALVFPGLKRSLLSDERVPVLNDVPSGWANDSEVLLGAAYHDIVRRFEEGVVDRAGRADAPLPELPDIRGRSITHVTVTFPTTLPPSARHRLRRLVRDGLRLGELHNVTMAYDEAVAAALFFLLRGFGGDTRAGIESFRARARLVPDLPRPTWRQYMLVIDIGGGTSDIALLQLDLVDLTDRPPTTGDQPEFEGRHYALRPRVLGTTGHPQLGGDLLTLRMFYWLKAALADGIEGRDVTSDDSLARRVLTSRQADPVPAGVRDLLRAGYPTHHPTAGAHQPAEGTGALRPRTDTFDHLWLAMENAKTTPGDGDVRFTLKDGLVRRLRPSQDRPWVSGVESLVEGESVTLTAAQFGQLVRPIIESVTKLATDLVHRRIGGQPDVRLDTVALSGRTAQLPEVLATVREVLGRELDTPADGRPPVPWDRTGVVVETTYAKQAASVGACWASSRDEVGATSDEHLAFGIDRLDIEIGQLQLVLPADFGLAAASLQPVPLLLAGQPFDMVDWAGQTEGSGVAAGDEAAREPFRFTRSGWRRAERTVCLHRVLTDSSSIEWGTFRYRTQRDREGYAPGEPIVDETRRVWFQVELAQDLTPYVVLCLGTESGVRPVLDPRCDSDLDGRDRTAAPVVTLAGVPELRQYFSGQTLGSVPRIDVVVVSDEAGPVTDDPVTLFGPGLAAEVFRYDLCVDGRAPGFTDPARLGRPAWSTIPGAVSAVPLPTPPEQSAGPVRYQFRAVLGDQVTAVGAPVTLPAPVVAEPPLVPCWVLLDASGRLRVHAGFPPYYLPVDSLREMEQRPGRVHRVRMDKGLPLWKPQWDPFTGDH